MKVHRIERAGGSASPSADPIAQDHRDHTISRLYQQLQARERDNDVLQDRIAALQNRDLFHLSVAANAHTFNNLLTIVQCHLKLLESAGGTPEAEDLATIRMAMTQAQQIAARMLRWNEVDEVRPLPVNGIVRHLARLTRPLLVPSVRLDLELDEAVPDILAAEQALLDALVNVVVNANDAMPHGRVRISTRTEAESVVIEIADDGPGMDELTRRRIFEAGFTTKGDDGHGIGLTSITALFRRVEGAVDVRSVPGEGTAFTFRFPIHRDTEPTRRRDA